MCHMNQAALNCSGITIQAKWPMTDAIIIPIMTNACEGRTTNNEKKHNKLQCIFSEAIKTLLYLAKGTPTTTLLNETGNISKELTIKEKKNLRAERIDQATYTARWKCFLYRSVDGEKGILLDI